MTLPTVTINGYEYPEGCECEKGDWWQCIDGRVYGPCGDENCGGVCVSDGWCDCPIHDTVEHDGNRGVVRIGDTT